MPGCINISVMFCPLCRLTKTWTMDVQNTVTRLKTSLCVTTWSFVYNVWKLSCSGLELKALPPGLGHSYKLWQSWHCRYAPVRWRSGIAKRVVFF